MGSDSSDHSKAGKALSTAEVLYREFEEIWGERPANLSRSGDPDLDDYDAAAFKKNQAALCLSGGGIRSAAFALGVIEGLAKKGLLTQFHYLSTVSGGGYIGGFVTRWIHEKDGDAQAVQSELARAATPGLSEPEPIQWLREYSNFLTPNIGLASSDTWSAGVLWIRNTLVNWFLFLPAFLAAVAMPNFYLASLAVVSTSPVLAYVFLSFALVLITIATYFSACDLPSHASEPATTGRIRWRIAAPSLAAAVAISLALTPCLLPKAGTAAAAGWAAAAVTAVGLILGYLGAWRDTRGETFAPNVFIWIVGALLSAAAVGAGPFLFAQIPEQASWRSAAYASLMPLWIVICLLLLTIFYAAFRVIPDKGTPPPLVSPDLDREWLARLSAMKLRVAVVGAVFTALALIGPILLSEHMEGIKAWVMGTIGTGSGLIAVFGGKAAKSGGSTPTGWRKALTFNRVVLLATAVFIALLVMLLSKLETSLVDLVERYVESAVGFGAAVLAHLLVTCLAVLLVWRTSKKINVNRYSLNFVYRNRLGRAFLGAARGTKRAADPFTQFDPRDNARMNELVYDLPKPATAGEPRRVLFPVVNLALNLVATERLAWQERKAHSFTVTPLACGSAVLGGWESGEPPGAYVETGGYAGRERDDRFPGKGISLATAMAISGAAASPSMGYNSSPATAFLMTLFNVRLGAWLPNPGYEPFDPNEMNRSAPTNSLRPFFTELLGNTNDAAKDIYLSDGGHFENLGIYEMIRRRCRYIVVSDAGYDPESGFEDLGNAVRKVMADLDGVAIRFDELKIGSRKNPVEGSLFAYALGEIDYGKDEAGNIQKGQILYVKPSYSRVDRSVDIRAYANINKDFPHESTADQWFSESQFESYRGLGEIIVSEVLGRPSNGYSGLAGFFQELKKREVVAGRSGWAPSGRLPRPADPPGLRKEKPPRSRFGIKRRGGAGVSRRK